MSPKKALSGASALLIAALLCAPFAARAAEKATVQTDLLVEQDYDSNIFGTETKKTDSLVTIIRPGLHFSNAGELGYMRLNGWLSSHTYWKQSEMNGVDRGASLEFDRKLTPRFSIFGDGSMQYFAKINEIRASDRITQDAAGQPVVTPGDIVEGNAPDVNIQQAVGGFRYALTPRSQLELSGGPYDVNYGKSPASQQEIRDRSGWFAGTTLSHKLTQLDNVSLSLSASGNDQKDVVSGQGLVFESAIPFFPEPLINTTPVDLDTGKSRSEQQSLTLGWQRTWSPVWTTDLTVGVRRLHTEVSGVTTAATEVIVIDRFEVVPNPTPPPPTQIILVPTPTGFQTFTESDFDDTGPGVVGSFRVSRNFARSAASLGYSRETRSTSSAVTSDVDVDTFSAVYTHLLAERVKLTLVGDYELYATANDSPRGRPASYIPGSFDPVTGPRYTCPDGKLVVTGSGTAKLGQCLVSEDNALHSQLLVLSARLDWQLRKRLGTFAVFRYYDRSGDEALFGNDYDKFNFGVGFRYYYDLDL